MKKLQEHLDEGWSVQVYDGDRHLLCSLYPSHGWAFFAGLLAGFMLALVSVNGTATIQSPPSISAPLQAPLGID
ncbi:MAG: hypothetical protein Kow00121_49880 [Elainellaceae cyanobacterium]